MTLVSASAEKLITTTRYESVALQGKEVYADIEFDTDWFDAPSSSYNHGLARASLGLATAAFRAKGTSYASADRNLRSFLA